MGILQNISIILNNNTSLRFTVNSPKGRRMEFVFRYLYVDSSWRAYIISSPSYDYRSTAGEYTHRYYDESRKLFFVCWTRDLAKFDDIVTVSKMWANGTAKYIDTGVFG